MTNVNEVAALLTASMFAGAGIIAATLTWRKSTDAACFILACVVAPAVLVGVVPFGIAVIYSMCVALLGGAP